MRRREFEGLFLHFFPPLANQNVSLSALLVRLRVWGVWCFHHADLEFLTEGFRFTDGLVSGPARRLLVLAKDFSFLLHGDEVRSG